MSSAILRRHAITIAFIHRRRARYVENFMRALRLRVSRRQMKRHVRALYA